MSWLSMICNSKFDDLSNQFLNYSSTNSICSLSSFRASTQSKSSSCYFCRRELFILKNQADTTASVHRLTECGPISGVKGASPRTRGWAPTCVADLEALLAGGVVGGPAQEQPVARAGEVGGFRVVPAQDGQEGALARRTCRDRKTEAGVSEPRAPRAAFGCYLTGGSLSRVWTRKFRTHTATNVSPHKTELMSNQNNFRCTRY